MLFLLLWVFSFLFFLPFPPLCGNIFIAFATSVEFTTFFKMSCPLHEENQCHVLFYLGRVGLFQKLVLVCSCTIEAILKSHILAQLVSLSWTTTKNNVDWFFFLDTSWNICWDICDWSVKSVSFFPVIWTTCYVFHCVLSAYSTMNPIHGLTSYSTMNKLNGHTRLIWNGDTCTQRTLVYILVHMILLRPN